MSNRAAYLHAAAQLRGNPGQWAAYEAAGHCVVLAGPGSGKTKTLTVKMARLLAEEVHAPRGVACITYNNECARELEERLTSLGVDPGGRVFVGTVHSFSLTQIILPYAKTARMNLPDGFSVATLAEQRAALRAALPRAVGEPRSRDDWEFQMANYRRTHLNRDSPPWRDTDPELADLIEAYEAELRHRGLIDFDDMPLLAVRALRTHPWLQRALLAKYPVLVVDEYQDLGSALHRMVLGLCFSAGMRLFAVGDSDQSIYGFTGARPNLLTRLSVRDDVETVHLRLNYRCGNRIVAASRVALGQERDYEAAEGNGQGAVFIHPMSATYDQQATRLIRELLPQALARHPDLDYRDVSILYPAAFLGDSLAAAAQATGIPLVRVDANALYPRNNRLMQWLEACGQWCCGGWKAGKPRFTHILRNGRRLFSQTLVGDEVVMDFHRRLLSVLSTHRNANVTLHVWLTQLQHEVIDPFARGCAALRDELVTYERFLERVAPDGDQAEMLLGELVGDGGQLNRLTLSTLHSAKGREFGLTFLFGMDNGRLPRAGSNREQIAEARRLFYVGITRAKTEVHLIHSAGRSSPFVAEIERHLAEQH